MFLKVRPCKDEKPEINQSLLPNEQFLKKVSTSNLLGTPNFNILFTYHGHLCHSQYITKEGLLLLQLSFKWSLRVVSKKSLVKKHAIDACR